MHPRLPRITRIALVALALLSVPTGGCKDDRGDPAGPEQGILDGEVLFASSVVSSQILRVMNRFVETALDLYESGSTTPAVFVPGCSGTGRAVVSNNNDSDPTTWSVTFDNYASDCATLQLDWLTDPNVDARMLITFLETSPGLVYEILLPMVGSSPRGFTVQLPADEGGFALTATTPLGPLLYQLDGTRGGLRHEGNVHVEGTLRLEDRAQPLILVEDLRLEYAFDDDLVPKLADWPGGSYEVGAFQGGSGGIGFGGSTPSFPVDVFFDGLGGVAFPLGSRTCVGDMAANRNPCENL